MSIFSLKLKQKFLGVIVLVVLIVMVVSSLVVSYVTYKQNIHSANDAVAKGIAMVKLKISELEEDLIRKTDQMNALFKVNENLKFLADFKKEYDLGMTEPAFAELATALFTTASSNHIQKMAVYDAAGELAAFFQQQKDGKLLVGYYYVNPEKAFKYTLVESNVDLKKSDWESGTSVANLEFQVSRSGMMEAKGLTEGSSKASIIREGSRLALSILAPVMMEDYNKETDKMEPKVFGFAVVSKSLDQAFVDQTSKLTGMGVNLFAGDKFSLGTVPVNKDLNKDTFGKSGQGEWSLEGQETLLGTIQIGQESYLEGLIPIFENNSPAGAIMLLTSTQIVTDNTLQVFYTLVIVFLCCIVLIIPLALLFAGTLVKSILKVTATLKDVAEGEGDLTKRIEIRSKDEIGELAQWFNLFIERLQTMISDISKSLEVLSGSVREAKDESGQISRQSGGMVEITQKVTSATGRMSSEVSSIAGVMGEAADNLDIVASSTEEMTATINEIARNAETARSMSLETAQSIGSASDRVNQLGKEAGEIDAFTELINEISEQTNLLALNATIEAARAGEAGKGFAVVAGEIKELARQTASATQDIKEKIENIKLSSGSTQEEMTRIAKSFGEMNDLVNDIASAIEEQSVTTKEIADNTSTVASGISNVNSTIANFDGLTTDIAGDMENVNRVSDEMSGHCRNINGGAEKMTVQTGKLADLVKKFVIE